MPTLKKFLILGSMHLCFSELHKRRIKCPVVAVSKHLTEISLQIWGEIWRRACRGLGFKIITPWHMQNLNQASNQPWITVSKYISKATYWKYISVISGQITRSNEEHWYIIPNGIFIIFITLIPAGVWIYLTLYLSKERSDHRPLYAIFHKNCPAGFFQFVKYSTRIIYHRAFSSSNTILY